MNLVAHLLTKDLRRARPLLAVWMVLLVVQASFAFAAARPADLVTQAVYAVIEYVTPALQILLLAVLIPFVIQEEPLVGTTAFWFTRPLTGSLLLRAKALFTLLVCVLPALLLQIGILAGNGVLPRQIALAVPEILLGLFFWIVLLAIVASLTSSFGRYATVGVSLFVATMLVELVLEWMRVFLHPTTFTMPAPSNISLARSGTIACELLCILLGGAVIAHQYVTRRTVRSLAVAGAFAATILTTQALWSWDFLAPPPLTGTPPFDLAQVDLDLGSLYPNDIAVARGTGAPDKIFQGEFAARGVPREYVLQIRQTHPRLELPDGSALPVKGAGESGLSINTEAFEAALGAPLVNTPAQVAYVPSFFLMDANTYDQHLHQPLNLSVGLDLEVCKYVVTAALPVAKGARDDRGSEHLMLTEVLRNQRGLDLLLRDRQPNLMFDRQRPLEPAVAFARLNLLFVLRNGKRDEAIVPRQDVNDRTVGPPNNYLLLNRQLHLAFGPEPTRNQLTPDLTPEWLADAELVRLELEPICRVSKTVRVPAFRLDGKRTYRPASAASSPDPALFDKIVLPTNPTEEQVRDYLRAIEMVSQRWNLSSSDEDRQVSKLAQAGVEHLEALIEARSEASFVFRNDLDLAIRRLVRPEDKELILAHLGDLIADPALPRIVVQHGWQADAHDILTRELSRRKTALSADWVKAAAALQDPATYADLEWYFIHLGDREGVFRAIRNLPGFELESAVEQAWKRARYEPTGASEMLPIAGEFGHEDTIDTAAAILRQETDDHRRSLACKFLKQFTPASGDCPALLAWAEANRGKLAFDPQTKKFAVRP